MTTKPMKAKLHTIALIALLSSMTSVLSQDTADKLAIDQIIQKRDAILTKLHEDAKNQAKNRAASEEHIWSAAIDLYVFRRDSATTPAGRLQWQERIVAIERERKVAADRVLRAGAASQETALRAEERLLAAQQRLLELQNTK